MTRSECVGSSKPGVRLPSRRESGDWTGPAAEGGRRTLRGGPWLVALPLLLSGLVGVSCQSNSDNCKETLTCSDGVAGDPGSGGTNATGGATSSGGRGTAGEGGLGGSLGEGGMAGAGGCATDEEDCGPRAIYVSPRGRRRAAGTLSDPVSTLARGIHLASHGGLEVFVCATEGAYEEDLELGAEQAGVAIRGGYDCDDFTPVNVPSQVVATDPRGHRIDQANGAQLERLHLVSPDATLPGESSFGLWIAGATGVVLSEVRVTAGDGAPGATGDSPEGQAEPGASGQPGTNACLITEGVNLGGDGVTTVCGGEPTVSVSGKGGIAGGGLSGNVGNPGDTGSPEGLGGVGGDGELTDVPCQNGDNGTPGPSGANGQGAGVWGQLSEEGYVPAAGAPGGPGQVGGGAGGGGGAKKPATCETGASGGSGGGGGCPGVGAAGGGGGGASMALVSYRSQVTLVGGTYEAGSGGPGGRGGDGQAGGSGGLGGPGGDTGGNASATEACSGGRGGKGGRGGSGGGGAGGPQVALAYVGEPPAKSPTGVGLVVGLKGAPGGPGGELNDTEEGIGSEGKSLKEMQFP